METIKNLQELINQKAEHRLNEEIGKISAFVKGHRLLSVTNNPGLPELYLKNDKGEYVGKKPYWMFDSNSGFLEEIKAYWLPIFIAEEAENFLKKVDELDSEIQGLKNVSYVDDY